MKNENGITMVSLIIYILVMIIVIGIMSQIITNFYKNTADINTDTESVLEFNKFNSYFLNEIKRKDIELDSIENNNILFSTGDTFEKRDDKIYYNNVAICSGVERFIATQDQNDDTIINIVIEFKNFRKDINYKLEELY